MGKFESTAENVGNNNIGNTQMAIENYNQAVEFITRKPTTNKTIEEAQRILNAENLNKKIASL